MRKESELPLAISIDMRNVIKRVQNQTCLNSAEHENFRQQILENVKMDTQTSFVAGGNITIYPCSWELDKQVTLSGEPEQFVAGVRVNENGQTYVKRYMVGKNGPKYETLFQTAHADVKRTRENHTKNPNRGCLKVVFRFPKRYPLALMKSLFYQESEEVMAYLNSRKEVTVWDND